MIGPPAYVMGQALGSPCSKHSLSRAVCQAGPQGPSTPFHWLSLYFRCPCGASGPEARNQPSARMYMNSGRSPCGFGGCWKWGSGTTRLPPPHLHSCLFSLLSIQDSSRDTGLGGWQEDGRSGEVGVSAEPPRVAPRAGPLPNPLGSAQSGLSEAGRGDEPHGCASC